MTKSEQIQDVICCILFFAFCIVFTYFIMWM